MALKFNNEFQKRFLHSIPGLFGLLSVSIGITGIILTSFLYPNYDPMVRMISDLGTAWLSPGNNYFNTGFIISGFINIPFSIYLGGIFKSELGNERLRKFAIISSIVSNMSLSMVGLTLMYSRSLHDSYFIWHGIFALMAFSSASIYCVIYSAKMLKDKRFYKIHAYIGFVIVIFPALFYITWQPILEWTSLITLCLWNFCIAIYSLIRKY
jgi:hypothetical membrane protein